MDEIENEFLKYKTNRNGLTSEQAQERLQENGKNVFPVGKQKNVILILLNQFKSAIIIILFVAIILSAIIGEYFNIVFIAAVILINTVIGFIQEYNAERSAQRLKTHIRIKVTVVRDGQLMLIDSEDLVVGDVVYLESGNKIPADIRLIETKNFKVDESILTGESEAIVKDETSVQEEEVAFKLNMVYAGTVAITGRAYGIVVKTGLDTEYGKIAKKITEIKNIPSPLTIRINKFTKQISIVFIVVALILSGILYFKGYDWYNIFFSVVALVVSAIPEGLTTGMTICLSLSSNMMAKRNVIVKQLSAVEGLGSCNIIASDKTGTLTVNEQTARKILLPDGTEIDVSGSGYNKDGQISYDSSNKTLDEQIKKLAILGASNNESNVKETPNGLEVSGDSIDIAFRILSFKAKTNENLLKEVARIPYESELKYSALKYELGGKNFLTIKGSVEVILSYCSNMLVDGKKVKLDGDEIIKQNTSLAERGYRVIAIADGEFDKELTSSDSINGLKSLTFIGLCGFVDPIRDDATEAIKKCEDSGIQIKMITGDHPLTAYCIGRDLNIVSSLSEVATGEKIAKMQKQGQAKFDKFVLKTKIFARVTPLQKHAIVEAYKRQGAFIAVSGDGVNDILALKEANIGISVGSGADIAKETADMIIVNDKFSSIEAGIEEGKRAYNNVRNIVYLLMSTGICEVMLYFLSILCNLSFPLTGVQFLWLNLVTNGIQSNVFAFEKNKLTKYNNKVRNINENIFNKLLMAECFTSTFYIGFTGFALYFILLKLGFNVVSARTYLLTYMVFFESIQAFNCRNEYISAFKCSFKNNPALVITILCSFIFQIVAIYIPALSNMLDIVPINGLHVLYMALFSITQILIMELFKFILRKVEDKKLKMQQRL